MIRVLPSDELKTPPWPKQNIDVKAIDLRTMIRELMPGFYYMP